MSGTNDPHRRLRPRIFDTDWLMLRGMTRYLENLISEHVNEGQTVLDFGCGNMPYRPLIAARKAVYLGADFGNEAAIAISPNGLLDAEDASVDVVISLQVLEHVRDLSVYFAEIARVLKPGGVLLLSTHGTWLYHPHPEDHRRWTRTGLVNDIEVHGFGVCEIASIVGPLGTTTMIRSTGIALFLRRIPLIGGLLAGFDATVMNVRGLIEESITPQSIRHDNGCVYITRCERF
jgi:SAM-dependent methyltransferase